VASVLLISTVSLMHTAHAKSQTNYRVYFFTPYRSPEYHAVKQVFVATSRYHYICKILPTLNGKADNYDNVTIAHQTCSLIISTPAS